MSFVTYDISAKYFSILCLNPASADLSLFPDAPANSKTVLFADFEMAGELDAAESEALAKAISDVIEDFFQEAQVDSW